MAIEECSTACSGPVHRVPPELILELVDRARDADEVVDTLRSLGISYPYPALRVRQYVWNQLARTLHDAERDGGPCS